MGKFDLEERFTDQLVSLGQSQYMLNDLLSLNAGLESTLSDNSVQRNPNNVNESSQKGGSGASAQQPQ